MTTALWLVLYGAALAWGAPPILRRMTSHGISPHMSVAAWLATVAATMGAWMVALVMVVVATAASIQNNSVVTLCLELFGFSDHTPLAGRVGSVALIGTGLVTAGVVGARLGRSLSGLRARSHEHAEAAWIVGRPTDHPNTVVVDADRPAAYCVIGRPNAIVLTSAAMQSLNRSELKAVLAHEEAHIAGHHHHILMLLRALSVTLPRLPLCARAHQDVAALLEMCADDAAARRVGIRPLLGGLLTLAGHSTVLPEGLAAAATAVVARAQRLVTPTRSRVRWRHRVSLAALTTGMLVLPAFIQVLCHH
jgi:Zn-dependent protease with chaperone function